MYIHIPIISNNYQEILKQSFLKFPLNKYSIMQIYTNALFPHSVYMYQVCIDVTKINQANFMYCEESSTRLDRSD